MTKSKVITARVSPKTKKEAEILLEEMGLSMSGAINLFLTQMIRTGGIPFPVTVEQKEEIGEK